MSTKMKCVITGTLFAFWLLLGVSSIHSGGDKQPKGADDAVVIEIKQDQGKYFFIKKGDAKQEPVVVVLGQTVRWVNQTKAKHTATQDTDQKGPDGKALSDKALFDTGDILGKGKEGDAKSWTFDEKRYKELVDKAGGMLKLEYLCQYHEEQRSSLILKSKK